jgi:subtilisin family serine protease
MMIKKILLTASIALLTTGLANAQDIPSWGVEVVGGGKKQSTGSVTVYILDGGVATHPDISSVSSRHGIPLNQNNATSSTGHATHVAGIIGAQKNNMGTVGIFPGVNIVSVNFWTGGLLTSSGWETTFWYEGIEKLYSLIKASGNVGIVNISANLPVFDSIFNYTTDFKSHLEKLNKPAIGYPGAFISMSAGNDMKNACSYSYGPAKIDDGIMVVGALGQDIKPVIKVDGVKAFVNQPYANDEDGSNFGQCVEIWAPGNKIYSTWAPAPSYVELSGTSMAAPMVAGIAAYLKETMNLTTPAQIEAAVRLHAKDLGILDAGGSPVKLAQIISAAPSAPRAGLRWLMLLQDD